MNHEELREIVRLHGLWLVGSGGGKRADLRGADLRWADLRGADLRGADLRWADLRGADLHEADLRGADLRWADLRWADLTNTLGLSLSLAQVTIVPSEGSFIGWKKCLGGVIVKLKIPENAKRVNALGRKCRAEFVEVLEVFGADFGISNYDRETVYRTGDTVRCDQWEEDRFVECGGGIHFFITREEAEDY